MKIVTAKLLAALERATAAGGRLSTISLEKEGPTLYVVGVGPGDKGYVSDPTGGG